jgi:hypothetical protein
VVENNVTIKNEWEVFTPKQKSQSVEIQKVGKPVSGKPEGRFSPPLVINTITNNQCSINHSKISSKEDINDSNESYHASNIIQRKKKEIPLQEIPITEKETTASYKRALSVLAYWEGKGLKPTSQSPDSKAHKESLQKLNSLVRRGAFNGSEYTQYSEYRFDSTELRLAIDRFALMALNPDYEPRSIKTKHRLSKMYPRDFVFSNFKSEGGWGRSMFIYCLENEPKLINERSILVEDKYPEYTNALIRDYTKLILGGSPVEKFTNQEVNDFRKASTLWKDYFVKNNRYMCYSFKDIEPNKFSEAIYECLLKNGETELHKIRPWWLSNSVMKLAFPSWLNQMAVMEARDTKGQKVKEFRMDEITPI